MLRLAIFCCLLVLSTSAKINETQICDDIAAIKAQVSNVLADLESKFEFCEIAYPSSCSADSTNSSQILIRVPGYSEKPFEVACDRQQKIGGGWTIILRRTDGSEDFYRGWDDYKAGFGQLSNEFFLGLDKINALTYSKTQELLVMLQDFNGNEVYEMFDNFRIGNEHSNYTLESIGAAKGNAGNSLAYHVGKPFGTKDRYYGDPKDNCAVMFKGAWWYSNCYMSNLCGIYINGPSWTGKLHWLTSLQDIKRAEMMIRPKTTSLIRP